MEAPKGLKYDNSTVCRHNGLWCMLYIQFDGKGYETLGGCSREP